MQSTRGEGGPSSRRARASPRRLEPEWLDALPPSDPRALRSRRDLGRINAIMRHAPRLRRLLVSRLAEPPAQLVELGGGDGRLLLSIAKGIGAAWRGVIATIVDPRAAVTPATCEAFAALGWRLEIAYEDADSYLRRTSSGLPSRYLRPPSRHLLARSDPYPESHLEAESDRSRGSDLLAGRDRCAGSHRGDAPDVIIANLFLHHLDDAALRRLFAQAAGGTQLFAACEPRRSLAAAAGSRLLWAIGCNDVSRHDAVVSVRAGFAGRELSQLWPRGPWRLEERAAGLFSHVFAARRADRATSRRGASAWRAGDGP